MAALSEPYANALPRESLVDLRELGSAHLAPLLEEEVRVWHTDLDWDFRPSAELVERFVHLRALNGFALANAHGVVGYAYYVAEEGKGLIGDFYVREAARSPESESRLLEAILESMWRTPGMRRIEAQLMMLGTPLEPAAAPYPRWFHKYPRRFLEMPLSLARLLAIKDPAACAFAPWSEGRQEEAAKLIAESYRGHIDSQINDQYRSAPGARRFLTNIVQYPGCGSFFAPASFVAWDREKRTMCGVSLASLVSEHIGHITQICVSPAHQGKGIGYELLRRSLAALAAHGCRSASLTVTSANESAIRLYRGMGFHNRRDFSAYVWEMR
jgi:ribosomal protein S18 acetylase RimI-like enzyme